MTENARLDWSRLLSTKRRPRDPATQQENSAAPEWLINSRNESERDFDRILFAAPTRRLGDKTQVFPLEKNESVRNRLTHSHEVSNLARSIGTHLVHGKLGAKIAAEAQASAPDLPTAQITRAIPAILAAAGLAHDMGNPPFGHQGEFAIRNWVKLKEPELFAISERQSRKLGLQGQSRVNADLERLTQAHKEDFRKFEGNAQTLRTLLRLQVVKDNRGLNLTFATLAALMKYTVPSVHSEAEMASTKKVGYFTSEAALVKEFREATGLTGHIRHPLTYLMEACDDIAYLIVDAEDAVKKQIVSFHDLIAWLESREKIAADPLAQWVIAEAKIGALQARAAKLSPAELNDVSMQIFRANAMTAMVSAVIAAFEEEYEAIMTTGLTEPLIRVSRASLFAKEMKEFDAQHAYRHRRVLEIELSGYNTLHDLLDMLWKGITEREVFDQLASDRNSPFSRYAYGRISENYRRVFEARSSTGSDDGHLPIRYRELQLLTDMVAGMTDQYAIDLHRELKGFHVGSSEAH